MCFSPDRTSSKLCCIACVSFIVLWEDTDRHYSADVLAHGTPFSIFLVLWFQYLGFLLWLVAFCQRYYYLVFFDVCFPQVQVFYRLSPWGCRGVGVGREAPHLRSIASKFALVYFVLSFLFICIYGPSWWAGVMVSPFAPSIVEEALFLRGRVIARSLRAHLSGALWAKNNTYTLWVNEQAIVNVHSGRACPILHNRISRYLAFSANQIIATYLSGSIDFYKFRIFQGFSLQRGVPNGLDLEARGFYFVCLESNVKRLRQRDRYSGTKLNVPQ